jgi:hypothetical protein
MNVMYCGKSSQKIRATSILFKKLPKVNNHPIGENWPNLVTLAWTPPLPDFDGQKRVTSSAHFSVWREKNCQQKNSTSHVPYSADILKPGDQCYDLKNIFAKKIW